MNRYPFLILLPGIFSVLSGSCGFFRVADPLTISWTELDLTHLSAAGPDSWTLSWLNSDGLVTLCRIPGNELPTISVPRESPVVIAASPVFSQFPAPYSVKPAGIVVAGDDPRSSTLQLSWKQGFSAVFLLRMAESGVSPGLINIRRFLDAVDERSESDPWSLDTGKLASEILSGDLWTYSFRVLDFQEVAVPLPPGIWYSEYPPDSPVIPENGIWDGHLTPGLHHFLRSPDCSVVSVSVDERGDVITFY
jgi:hypothetical protein